MREAGGGGWFKIYGNEFSTPDARAADARSRVSPRPTISYAKTVLAINHEVVEAAFEREAAIWVTVGEIHLGETIM
jgi:hypothetical protein